MHTRGGWVLGGPLGLRPLRPHPLPAGPRRLWLSPHLLPAHEALLLPEVHVIDGEALLCPRLEGHRPIQPGYHTALPASHLWPGRGTGCQLVWPRVCVPVPVRCPWVWGGCRPVARTPPLPWAQAVHGDCHYRRRLP